MKKRSLMERLETDGIVCAEGYLFEMERRGYLTAGEFVPEVALEHPEALAVLHRDFQHAGSVRYDSVSRWNIQYGDLDD